VGGGLAGLSAAIYLGRARRTALILDSGKSMARWEPDVQNYLGFPQGVRGQQLLQRARSQARRYGIRVTRERVRSARLRKGEFHIRGEKDRYRCKRLLLATGIFHVPPDIPDIKPCIGHSSFFCKDCDGYRVQGKSIGVYGWTNEAVEYALAMVLYSSCVTLLTDGRKPCWDKQHDRWLAEYQIPISLNKISRTQRRGNQISGIVLKDGTEVAVQALFTTRADIYFSQLARGLGAKVDAEGQIVIDSCMRTSVPGVYAAGCVTPANCQMIIAAGQGAAAAQAINRDLFEESLATHSLRQFRRKQIRKRRVKPAVRKARNGQVTFRKPNLA